jgi:Fe-S oxidoreductase
MPNRITDVVLNKDILPADGFGSYINEDVHRVIYLSDPYTRHIEPQVEQAAFDILNILGYEVILLPIVSSGVALISKGFLNEARRHAERVLNVLNKIDPDGIFPIVGIEPPEIYSLKHDYVDLLPERAEEIRKYAGNVWLLEELVIRSKVSADMRVANLARQNSDLPSTKIKFHPHCHQRAESPSLDDWPNGVNATIEMLRVCGYDVELVEAGCCGMAGTFGYEAEHYELSLKIGELKLFPYIRQLTPSQPSRGIPQGPPNPLAGDNLSQNNHADLGEAPDRAEGGRFASTGTACRMQIEQGTGAQVEHPILLAARVICPETKV